MPQMADLVVKDVNGTTDITFSALTPAGADGSPAIWRWENTGLLPSQRVRFEMSSRWNGPKDARKVTSFLNMPINQATAVAGVYETIANVQFRNGDMIGPQNAPDTDRQRAAVLFANLMKTTLVQSVLLSGFAPN